MNKLLLFMLIFSTVPLHGMEHRGQKRHAEDAHENESALKKQHLRAIAESLQQCYAMVGLAIPHRVESPQPQQQARISNSLYSTHDCLKKLLKFAKELYTKKSYQEAHQMLTDITDLQEDIVLLQGKTAAKLGNFKKAQESFNHAITDFNSADALCNLLRLHAHKRLDEDDFTQDFLATIIARFEKAHPTHGRLLSAIADYYESLSANNKKLVQTTIKYLEKSRDNGNQKAYYKLGNIYYKQCYTSRSNKKQNAHHALFNYNRMLEALAKESLYSSPEKATDIRRKCEIKIRDLHNKFDMSTE